MEYWIGGLCDCKKHEFDDEVVIGCERNIGFEVVIFNVTLIYARKNDPHVRSTELKIS